MIQTYKILKYIDRIDSNAFFPNLNIKGQWVITWNYTNLNLKQSLENMH